MEGIWRYYHKSSLSLPFSRDLFYLWRYSHKSSLWSILKERTYDNIFIDKRNLCWMGGDKISPSIQFFTCRKGIFIEMHGLSRCTLHWSERNLYWIGGSIKVNSSMKELIKGISFERDYLCREYLHILNLEP